jgi:hypothetical protein
VVFVAGDEGVEHTPPSVRYRKDVIACVGLISKWGSILAFMSHLRERSSWLCLGVAEMTRAPVLVLRKRKPAACSSIGSPWLYNADAPTSPSGCSLTSSLCS